MTPEEEKAALVKLAIDGWVDYKPESFAQRCFVLCHNCGNAAGLMRRRQNEIKCKCCLIWGHPELVPWPDPPPKTEQQILEEYGWASDQLKRRTQEVIGHFEPLIKACIDKGDLEGAKAIWMRVPQGFSAHSTRLYVLAHPLPQEDDLL